MTALAGTKINLKGERARCVVEPRLSARPPQRTSLPCATSLLIRSLCGPTAPCATGLTARLGLGKSLLKLAPEALIGSLLQVALGSVTPLALCQPGAAGVVLLVDAGIQGRDRVAVHPLVNTASVLIAPSDLEALLR